ncbi:MAG: hypothetical protein U0792_05240 [Gemmataceae bacterium]
MSHLNGEAVVPNHKPKQHGPTAELPAILTGSGTQPEDIGDAVPAAVTGHQNSAAGQVTSHPFWLQTNGRDQPGVFVPHWVTAIVSEGNEMLMLAQLNFWFRFSRETHRFRASVSFDGHVWLAKSYAELGAEVNRNERQVKKAIAGLVKKGFVVVVPRKSKFHGGSTVSHHRLDWDVIEDAYEKAVTKKEDTLGDDLM